MPPDNNKHPPRTTLKAGDWIAIITLLVSAVVSTGGYMLHRLDGADQDRRQIDRRLARIEGALELEVNEP